MYSVYHFAMIGLKHHCKKLLPVITTLYPEQPHAPVAQWIEQQPSKLLVEGSIPSGRASCYYPFLLS